MNSNGKKSNLHSFRRFHIAALLSAAVVCGASGARAERGASVTPTETVLQQITRGSYASAAQHLRQALQIAPDDATLNNMVGVLALDTGDRQTARSAFQHALQTDAQDSLALYGLGLAQMANGDRASAMKSFDRSESAGGDKTYLLIARRYAQWLGGAQVAVSGAGLPDSLAPAQNALQGMDAARQGDWRQAAGLLDSALSGLPGDAILQPGGLLMSFDAARPLNTGAPRLPAGSLTVAPDKGVLSGDIQFSPDGALDGVVFVSYELDGQPLGVVNVKPFAYTWDSRRVKNGQHDLTVVLHDAAVREIARSTRKIRIYNAEAGVAADQDARDRIQGELWQALALHPDRCASAYTLGLAARALGQTGLAQMWFARAVAIQPDYRDARRQWLTCGGVGDAGSALWGGLGNEKIIALTFDDGPKPGLTEPLLDILKQEGAVATFFVIGRHVMEYPELTKQAAEAGIEIANHSYTHPNLTRLSDTEVAREVMETQAAIQTVTGRAPRFLRPPGGNWNPRVAQIARAWGLTPCMWTVDVYGSEVIGAQQVANAVLAQVHPGSIILMHNGKLSTLQALPTIIRELRKRGYTFATVDTLERRLAQSKNAIRQQNLNISRRIE